MLPFEVRDFKDYMNREKQALAYAQQEKLRCPLCGSVPLCLCGDITDSYAIGSK